MISRETFDALSEDPSKSLKNAIIAFLSENSDNAYTADEINNGIGSTDVILAFDHPVMIELRELVTEGTIQEKTSAGEPTSYYAINV